MSETEILSQEEISSWLKEDAAEGTKEPRNQILSVGNEKYICSMKAGSSGIHYVSLLSTEAFAERIEGELAIVRLLLLISLCSSILALFFFLKKVVWGVKRINQLLDEDSCYDLGTIEAGIQTLLAINDSSKDDKLILGRSDFIRSFVRGDFFSREDVLSKAREVNLFIDFKGWLVVLVHSDDMRRESAVYAKLLERILKSNRQDGYGIHLVNNNQNLFVLFGDSEEELWQTVEGFSGIMQNHSENFIIAVSDYHTDFTEGAQAYLEVEEAFDCRGFLSSKQIISFSQLEQKKFVKPVSEEQLKQLKYNIRVKDSVAVEKMVRNICDSIEGEKVSLYTFKVFYNHLIYMLLTEWKGKESTLRKLFNVFSVSQCMNRDEFCELICDMCTAIMEESEERIVDGPEIFQSAIEYINKNFMDPNLNVNAVAAHLNVSATRIGLEFKSQMDVMPLDYLTRLRIEEAKKLLVSSGMSIQDISYSVGYVDVHVFIRWFKKYVGTTPGKYRKEYNG